MVKIGKSAEISIMDLLGREILKYTSPVELEHQQLLQKAVVYAAENRLTLKNADLKGIVLNKVDLTGLVLDGSDLEGAIIKGSNLDLVSMVRSNLTRSKIINTSMERSILDGASFNHAVLYKVDLGQSSLISTSFYGAHIRESNLNGAHALVGVTSFEGAFLQNTTMQRVALDQIYLSRAILNRVDMTEMAFSTGQFQSTKFNLVNFTNAQLKFMHGQDTEFRNSNINHAILQDCHLKKFIINDKHYGNINIMPTVIEHLQDTGYQFVREPERYKYEEMLEAIRSKNQSAIDKLVADHRHEHGEYAYFDMQAHSFRGMDLSGLKFQLVDFAGSDFSGANMSFTDLSNSIVDGAFVFEQGTGCYDGLNLSEASAKNVFFNSIKMNGAIFYDTDISFSKFNAVIADHAILSAANLYGTQIENNTRFTNSDFTEIRLLNTTISHSVMQGDYRHSEISNSNFKLSDLSGSNFQHADMRSSNFLSTDLNGTNFENTEPRHLHFYDVSLVGAQLKGIKPNHCEFKTTDLGQCDASHGFFKNTIMHDVFLDNAEMGGAVFVDSQIRLSDVDKALNPSDSMLIASGQEVKSTICNKEETQAYLQHLQNQIKEKAPKPDYGYDASM